MEKLTFNSSGYASLKSLQC